MNRDKLEDRIIIFFGLLIILGLILCVTCPNTQYIQQRMYIVAG